MNSYMHLSVVHVYSKCLQQFWDDYSGYFFTDNTPIEFLMKYESAEET